MHKNIIGVLAFIIMLVICLTTIWAFAGEKEEVILRMQNLELQSQLMQERMKNLPVEYQALQKQLDAINKAEADKKVQDKKK